MYACACVCVLSGEGRCGAGEKPSCVVVLQAVSREFICEECQNSTLNKLESMLEILQTDTKQGTVTPTEIGDNILNIMGETGRPPRTLSHPPLLHPSVPVALSLHGYII